MRRARLILLLFAVCAVRSVRANGQATSVRGTLDVGLSRVSEANVPTSTGASIGTTFDAVASRAWLRASALGVAGSGLRASGQALAAGSFDVTETGAVRPFVGGSASFFTQNALGPSTSGELSLGARSAGGSRGLSVLGSAGVTSSDGAARSVYRALTDAWAVIAGEQLSATLGVTSSQSRFVDGALTPNAGTAQQYVDAAAAWRHERGGLSLGLTTGIRSQTAAAPGGGWGSADVGVWLTSRAAIVLAGGNSLADVVRGIPRTRYVTAAIRIATQPHATAFRHASLTGPRMLAQAVGDLRRIDVLGVAASRVEIMSDFTQWEAVPLERVGTIWRFEKIIVPGPHRVAIRIDGGEWIVPANLPRVDDDLGGSVGVITVP